MVGFSILLPLARTTSCMTMSALCSVIVSTGSLSVTSIVSLPLNFSVGRSGVIVIA